MEEFLNTLIAWATDFGLKLLASIVVLIVGRILIKWVVKLMTKSKFAKKNDVTVVTVLSHFITAGLYVLLVVIIIGILGIPTASVITVIASAGVAIGLTYGKSLAESCDIGSHLAASVIATTESVCPRFLPRELGLDMDVED